MSAVIPSGRAAIGRVSWVFDVISPFAYLASKQLNRVPASVQLDFVPVLFAGLLHHHGQIGNAEIESKRRFTYRFVSWRSRQLGIPLRMPPAHPFNPLAALRLILAAGSTRDAVERVFDAVFRDGRDVTDPAVIGEIAASLGIADATRAIEAPPIKQTLRDNTQWAIDKGVFGVPTWVIGRELFWGQDAFDMALDYLRDPVTFDDSMQAVDSLPVGVMRRRGT